MSYISIVGGKIIETTGGEYNIYAKGDIVTTSATSVTETGAEEGVSFDKDPKKGPIFENNRNSINVNLNIFFDGTGNNKTNTAARDENSEKHEDYKKYGNQFDDSYENDYTNVARGFNAINPNEDKQVAVYVEGMGTNDLKWDNKIPGVSFGKGNTGVPAKVTKACMYAGNEMFKKKYHRKKIDYLFVNVYGFSRGAAAARHFIHVASKKARYSSPKKVDDKISKYYIYSEYQFSDEDLLEAHQFELKLEDTAFVDKHGYFGACLLKNEINPKHIVFNFVGLYDCVASFGMNHDSNTEQLNLNSITKAKFIYHLASDDEYRKNFPLTDISSAGIKGIEFLLPGVHSDIGGSYLDNFKELSAIDSIITYSGKESKKMAEEIKDKDFDAFKKIVEEEGWYKPGQIEKTFYKEVEYDGFFTKPFNQFIYGLLGTRILKNSYDKIPLHLMVNQSKYFKVIYDENILKTFAINDGFIKGIQSDINQYIDTCNHKRNDYIDSIDNGEGSLQSSATQYLKDIKKIHYKDFINLADLKKLRNEYLHWSVKSNFLGLDANNPGPKTEEHRKRHLYHG